MVNFDNRGMRLLSHQIIQPIRFGNLRRSQRIVKTRSVTHKHHTHIGAGANQHKSKRAVFAVTIHYSYLTVGIREIRIVRGSRYHIPELAVIIGMNVFSPPDIDNAFY